MFDILDFISKDKSMLIAPAGFGKTHTIAECLKNIKCVKKQLILTHTHAGVASIKEKIKKENIIGACYEVETITSFAQKYVLSFYLGTDLPEQEDSKLYYPFILDKAIMLIKRSPIKQIVSNTYGGLFVDEYQDCTTKQHELIFLLSELFPTHILGDFLQGIFGFNGEQLVDMNSPAEMKEFSISRYDLETPYRWLKGNNAALGEDLKQIRQVILNNQGVELNKFPSIETNIIVEADLYNPTKTYNQKIRKLLKEESVLLIHPDSTSINPRLNLIKLFNNGFTLIESIDDKDFYKLAKEADLMNSSNVIEKIITLCHKLFNRTGIQIWFNDKGFKRKTSLEDKNLLFPIETKIKTLEQSFSYSFVAEILKDIKKLTGIKCYRRELFNSFCTALEDAEYQSSSVFEAMINKRNLTRRVGRKIYGRCIGTTLLTKGLEFETVAIINAHKFNCPKHLYVALTRASKRLIIFTEQAVLKPSQY